jgi:galactose mutarotase-like enzyme
MLTFHHKSYPSTTNELWVNYNLNKNELKVNYELIKSGSKEFGSELKFN